MDSATVIWTLVAVLGATLLALSNRLPLGKANIWRKLPPGNLGWPLIGHTIEWYQTMTTSKPYRFNNSRREKFGNVFVTNYFGTVPVVISTPEIAKEVLFKKVGSGHLESTRQMLGTDSLIIVHGEKHTRLRKMIQPFLLPERLKTLIPTIEQTALAILELGEGDVKDHTLLHRKYAFTVICTVFMGAIPDGLMEVMEEAYPWIKKGIVTVPLNLPGTTYRKSLQARKRIENCILQAIDKRKREFQPTPVGTGPSNDLISHLLNLEHLEGTAPLSDKEMVDMFVTMLIAGIDTTALNVSFGMMWMAENPETLKQVREEQMAIRQRLGPGVPLSWKELKEMEMTLKVVQETLRLTCSPFALLRETHEDIPINGGYTIPKGMSVEISIMSLHTDPNVFGPDPETFRASRWKDSQTLATCQYMPFGYGPRSCVGMDLAKFEILTFFHHLMTNYSYEVVETPSLGFLPEALFKSGLKICLRPLSTNTAN